MWVFLWELFLAVAWIVGVGYLGGKLLAQDPPEAEGEIEGAQSRSWNPRTTQTEGLPRPRALGKNLHHGNIIAKWTAVTGSIPNQREKLYMIVQHGDGPTQGIGANLVYLNDQPSGNFEGVTIQERLGTMDQTVMTGFEKTKLEYNINAELMHDVEQVFTTPNDFFDDLEWTLICPNGLRHYHDDGSMHTEVTHIHVRIRPLGGGWTTIFDDDIPGKLHGGSEPIFKPQSASSLGFSCTRGVQYEVEVKKVQPIKEGHVNNIYLKSVREVVDIAFTRPGKALVGIKAVATSKLSGNVDVKVIREDRIINTWNGTVWTLQYSRNRAWAVWDIFTQPIITGNGIGTPYSIVRYEGIDPQYLDLAFFYAWAQFCDEEILDGYGATEPRCACDIIVDAFTDVFSLSHKIAEVGRAHIYWRGDKLTGWIDDVVTAPIDLVTMDSMMHKTWKNAWAIEKELAGVVEVFYKDSMQGYERTSADFPGLDPSGFTNIVSLEGYGITSRGAAVHLAHYLLERNRLIRNTNTFRTHKDGFRYKLGNVIRLQSRPANWGHAFRVISWTVDTITVDRDVIAEVTVGDVLHIRSWDVATEQVVTDTYEVDSVLGRVITVTVNWDVTPAKGNLVAVGPAGDIKLRRITKLLPTQNNYFDVTVETYDVDLFDADDIDPDNPNVNYIWPGPAGGLTGPVTRAEIGDLVSQILPPQPNTDIPTLANTTWTGDTVDTVTWSATNADDPISFTFKGTIYEITADNTTDEFIYWNPAFSTVYLSTNLASTAFAPGMWPVCINKDGVAHPVNGFQLIHAAALMAGTIRAETYLELRQTYVYNGDDSLDSAHPFEIPFKIVSELIDIISVKLSFKLMPYRAYSTAAASGGQPTTEADGTPVTGSDGPGSTGYDGSATSGGATPGTNYAGATQTGYADGPGSHYHGITGGSHPHTVNNHQHSTPAHSHNINNHTHSVGYHTHSIENHAHGITYGLHEESNSPTVHYHIDNGAGFGGASGNYNASQLDIDITAGITGTGWKGIRFDTNLRCRIAAIIECKLDIDA